MAARCSVSHNALLSLLPRPMLSSRAPSRLLRPSKVLAMARRGFSSQEDDFASPDDLRFEPPLKIVEYPHPILRARNKGINTFDENLKKLADEMFDVMYKTDGIGLSAPQVGINVQLMVFNSAGERGEGEEIILVNPIVYRVSKKTVLFNEGCLSFPGIYADVERPASIKIDARDITGGSFRVNLSGLPARVFQHEFDHLQQGVLFFDRMTEEVLSSIRSQLKALEVKYESQTGLQSPERIDDYKRREEVAGFGRA
ncbi:peptide deformylase 1B, chloroplastic isoform X1 [Dioscorea cayenensis subsp. rotundata]|uniref:Peptide deformylase n=1 Tax=Dioscorea cayennensis subsp. rotundata TaxID=55577 RepID=A0AB40B250_DIOCR|nr:peptide deformylase 1B, chloroplastic isoform X1 [Dioscorea cayenensis subsp. rotundata]XP_039121256.1 peptide deformylase 1B, chloroplastic isoform X1 [Dioscorea cayenensis subsp. rotundata]